MGPHRGGSNGMFAPNNNMGMNYQPHYDEYHRMDHNRMGAAGGRYNNGVLRYRGGYSGGGGGGYLQGGGGGSRMHNYGPRRIVGELTAQPNQSLKSQVEQAFDFEEANAKFDKSVVASATQGTGSSGATGEGKDGEENTTGLSQGGAATTPNPMASLANVKRMYDKKVSFFDAISCETLDRQAGQEARMDRNKQRQLDVETFGQTAAQLQRRGPRGYRHGGGGGMGGYRRGGGGGPMNNGNPQLMQGYMAMPPMAAAGGGGNARGYPSYPYGGRF